MPHFKFQESRMSGIIVESPIQHLQVGSLDDKWFLTHFRGVPVGQEVPHFKFQMLRMSGTLSRRLHDGNFNNADLLTYKTES